MDLTPSDRVYLRALIECDDGYSAIAASSVARRLPTPNASAIVTGKALSKLAKRGLCERFFVDGMWMYRPGHLSP